MTGTCGACGWLQIPQDPISLDLTRTINSSNLVKKFHQHHFSRRYWRKVTSLQTSWWISTSAPGGHPYQPCYAVVRELLGSAEGDEYCPSIPGASLPSTGDIYRKRSEYPLLMTPTILHKVCLPSCPEDQNPQDQEQPCSPQLTH